MKDALKQSSFEIESSAAPMKCLWMLAGVAGYKLCDREYDCEHCPFDSAIHEGAHAQVKTREALTAGDVRIGEAGLVNLEGITLAGALFYHPAHAWARIEEEGRVRIGLDDFGQQLTGRIYSAWLPAPGTSVERSQPCFRLAHQAGEIEIAAPVTGIVIDVNARLAGQPSLINSNPYGEGWVMMVEPVRLEACLKQLLYGQKARAWCERDLRLLYQRLNELLINATPAVGATMQDGGARVRDFTNLLAADPLGRLIDSFLKIPAAPGYDPSAKKGR